MPRTPEPANKVTADLPGAMPRSTESGSQHESSSFSAKQKPTLPGVPSVARSTPPGLPPPTLRMIELQGAADGGVGAVALAERVDAGVHADRLADGTVHDDDGPDEHRRRDDGMQAERRSSAASTAAMTTGMYSGRQPAMTALIATFSTVHGS